MKPLFLYTTPHIEKTLQNEVCKGTKIGMKIPDSDFARWKQ